MKSHDSSSSLGSYATISSISIRKSDSGFSESTSSIPTLTFFEQILVLERTYHETLKEYISKYSRPLRRYLNPTEIVDLFQNIEKVILKKDISCISMKYFFSDFSNISINCSSL